ncbi:PREDICTED: zinc finger protein ZPR1-like isoform X1 [Priapulus caudatus]|uniref:Zinc finger protein ZPR1-like isoform X1 n=1 Tax=Priapulus caudatus TaxID=37621 RepID=A0ABM1EJ28_PRICU|nr:PREDICTED: zinc finger protein ZPR1-like isoform X1 [Priapulus caudatus]XP_014672200.1 PREDICTED: zinc finger protein ZPR1-like isoform X1 [Priapulus caudatus]XP_014672201.1 PREDICTED: zinc finger protein ZPR1-like isoform X1 [Priapulus caudatus]
MTAESFEYHEKNRPLFTDLTAEDDDSGITEIESLCINCEKSGVTRLLLTKIPFYKDVIISSFNCDHCGNSNSDIQPGGMVQEHGIKITVAINSEADLNRQVVKMDTATVKIPEIDLEVPAHTQSGTLTTIEGILERAITGLEQEQPIRYAMDEDLARKIEKTIEKLKSYRKGNETFTLILDDPSGNSFVQNLLAPANDPRTSVVQYARSLEQNKLLALVADDEHEEDGEEGEAPPLEPDNLKDEVLSFKTNCPNCSAPADTNMKVVDIPYFKDVIIMATTCDACGHRTNEVKAGTGMSPKGTRITLHLTDPSDLSRDVLKSETCSLEIPELELIAEMGTLGGRFTTLEGLLTNVKEQLESNNPFTMGDSATPDYTSKMARFVRDLDTVIRGERLNVHIVLDDPVGNSYLQNVYAPDPDPEMESVTYERSFQQNEDLGLNDMNTESYAEAPSS